MEKVIKKVLPTVKEFKAFWESHGPFTYALCSTDFPDYLLEPEEWLFSNEAESLLKELTGWKKHKMKMVHAPVSKKKKDPYLPENLSDWRIDNFPDSWVQFRCRSFAESGQLTSEVTSLAEEPTREGMEKAFFKSLETTVTDLGYKLIGPSRGDSFPELAEHLKEWQEDEDFDGGFK